MNNTIQNENQVTPPLGERWDAIAQPGSETNDKAFNRFLAGANPKQRVLNCSLSPIYARQLTNFSLPAGVTAEDCIASSVTGNFPESLRGWTYKPKVRKVSQLPAMKALPPVYTALGQLPWFETASPTRWLGINARLLRHNHELWQNLRAKRLQGVNTTLVLALPQIAHSLTPHIQLENLPLFFFSLARGLYPAQLFPARYVYPDANLGALADAPAPMFGDILPLTGGNALPVVDSEPEITRMLARFGRHNRYIGYPFTEVRDPEKDIKLTNFERGAMLLPDGRRVMARCSETTALATLDAELNRQLLLDCDEFAATTGLLRAAVTHDGLPIQLPVEMQPLVFAIIFTHWSMEMDNSGDLSSYTVSTKHAAIRGFNYYQRVEPCFSQFIRLYHDLVRDSNFATYPLSNHLNEWWMGGNLQISNRLSESEQASNPNLLRAYAHQQLDWMAGVVSLFNRVDFRTHHRNGTRIARTAVELENELGFDGLAFHQMARHLLRFDSHLFPRPKRPASLWPNTHPGFAELDRHLRTETLPRL